MLKIKMILLMIFGLLQILISRAEEHTFIESSLAKLSTQSDTIIDSVQACNSHTWIDGNTYYQSNYTAIFTQSPDTVYKLALNIDSLDVQVQLIGNTLHSSVSNALLQWVDCDDNYTPIIWQNAPSFTPTQNGNYAVIAVTLNCSDTSNCVTLNNLSIQESDGRIIQVYPNPSKGRFFIEGIHSGSFSVTNLTGQIIFNGKLESGGTFIDLSHKAKGVYVLVVTEQNEKKYVFRLFNK